MQRYLRSKVKLVLAVLIILLAFSCYLTYDFHQKPLTYTRYVPTCSYQQTANYNYTIFVKPSIVYGNRTTLLPGETAYMHLVKHVDVFLAYNFTSNPPIENLQLTYNVTATLEAKEEWTRTYTLTPQKTQNLKEFHETYTLDIEETDSLIKAIEKEIGTRTYTYNYKIIPQIHIEASTTEDTITEGYNPTLTITLDYSKRKLTLTGLTNTKTGSIGYHETTETSWNFYGIKTTVRSMLHVSYVMIIITTCLSITLGTTAWYIGTKKPPPPFMTTLKKEYKEKIIEATEPLTKQIQKATIKVKSIEDLAKVSEETFKPIIHETTTVKNGKVKRHTFYLLDADVKYELLVEEPTESSTKQKTMQTKTQTNG